MNSEELYISVIDPMMSSCSREVCYVYTRSHLQGGWMSVRATTLRINVEAADNSRALTQGG